MGKVVFGMTMSLDGFVADPTGDVSSLYPDMLEWRQTETAREIMESTGAVVMGRHSYDMAGGGDWSDYEFRVPIFVLTHHPPDMPARGRDFTFVTDGVESAIRQARAAAGDKDVTVVGGVDTGRQLLRMGLIDEIQIDIMPILLGDGLKLFERRQTEPIQLEHIKVRESGVRTELRFRVVK
jgi:dihydrofolate reductase